MNNLKLIKPNETYIDQIIKYKEEFLLDNSHLHGTAGLSHYPDISEWLQHVKDLENKETIPACNVPSTLFLTIDIKNNELIGMIDIRHYLNQNLMSYGGHIGYSIKPSKRRLGYGTKQLSLALEECKKMNINEVLITCDEFNIGSKKIILNNNGIFHSKIKNKDEDIERYWIKL